MRLEIALINLVLISILLVNYKYLKDSKKLNTKVFFWVMVSSAFIITLEYWMRSLSDYGNTGAYFKIIQALYFVLLPVYFNFITIYGETWVFGIRKYSVRDFIVANLNVFINIINITVWMNNSNISLSSLGFTYDIHRIVLIICSVSPLAAMWIRFAWNWDKRTKAAIRELFWITIPVAIGGIIQIIDPDLPTFWTGSVISQIMVFFNLLNGHSMKDHLTQLGNRRLLAQDWNAKVFQRRKPYLGGLYLDVDRFKTINDTYGHAMGDSVLIEVAQLLLQSRHSNDGIYRIGGDEFFMLVELEHEDEIEIIRDRILDNCMFLNRRQLYPFELGLSIGIKTFNHHSVISFDDFLASLDSNMYLEKKNHRLE